jgi:hypothetical protein
LTLAKRLGLISTSVHEEWSLVEKRSEQREECEGSCPICQEKQGTQACVILSCSYAFHSSCLKSFEKFVKKTLSNLQKSELRQKIMQNLRKLLPLLCNECSKHHPLFHPSRRFILHMHAHPSSSLEVNRKY